MIRDDYRQGSYKGVPFDCQSANDTLTKAVAFFEYPDVDDPDVEDTGTGSEFRMKIFFLNEKYSDWQKFRAAYKEQGPGELVHPWEGPMQAIGTVLAVVRDNRIDCAEVDVTFRRVRSVAVVTTSPTLKSRTDELAASNQAAAQAENDLLAANYAFIPASVPVSGMGTSGYMATVTGLSTMIRSKVSVISNFVGQCLGYINRPIAGTQLLISDMATFGALPGMILGSVAGSINAVAGIYIGVINLPAVFATSLCAGFSALEASFGSFGGDGALQAIYLSNKGRAKCMAVAVELRADEAYEDGDTFTLKDYGLPDAEVDRSEPLTMDDIDAMVADARGSVDDAIAAARTEFGDSAFGLVQELKNQAFIIQDMADQIRLQRPRIINYQVPSGMSVQLLCFLLYRDIRRAPEVLKLNRIPDPNFLKAGDVLRVYAS